MKSLVFVVVALFTGIATVSALQPPEPGRRFDRLAMADPSLSIEVLSMPAGSSWEPFRAAFGREWNIHIDRRSGAPLLVEGKGIPWSVPKDGTVPALAASLKAFVASHRALLLADDAELVLDPAASGALGDDVWQVVFDRVVAGVPVAGERYLFTVGHGNLISFGASRWSRIDTSPIPDITAVQARERLATYMGLTAADTVTVVSGPELELIALRPAGSPTGRFTGTIGTGYASALVWQVAVRVEGEEGTWLALVDAHSGAIRSFGDDNKYVRVKGGVYPLTDDAICPSGCEQPNYPMPFADITIAGVTQAASTMGNFACAPTSVARTTLNGPYVKVADTCGAISQALSCAADLNLGTSAGTDCTVPAGASAGNTHASRTAFHHLNRIAEHARSWLPSVTWLTQQFTVQVNIATGCLGGWISGGMQLGRSGSGCFNAGENAAVMYHEWGHGLDENDGGGFDNPTEGYADITAFMRTHLSCIGRGFMPSNCTNFGDTCLNCTGAREDDWDQTTSHTPATIAGFAVTFCADQGAIGGPCGKDQHCEGIVSGQAIWDLAVRDLPAMGLDQATAWAVMDRLWYRSRLGSGGNAYNCALPDADSCLATSWFEKIRAVDDDDGNLSNGTPHAAAIFAAFDRHGLGCGLASDATNQNSSSCAALGVPVLTAAPGSTSATVQLTWTTVPNATGYRILRNDLGCQAALTPLTTGTANTLVDSNLSNGIPMYYSVQAMAGNEACDGGVSSCQQATPQPSAGAISLDSGVYGCAASTITVTVVDGNGAATLSAAVKSTTESTAETVTLNKIAAGSTIYRGTILTTSNPPAANGVLSVTDGDTITATYIDANDGGGGLNVPRVATASAACAATAARPVPDGSFGTAMKGSRATPGGTTINLTWDVATCTSSDYHVLYGDLFNVAALAVTGSACNLGTSGTASWTGVPSGSLWFTLVGDDDGTTEGSWGRDGTHAERGGATVSGLCGMTVKNNTGTCP